MLRTPQNTRLLLPHVSIALVPPSHMRALVQIPYILAQTTVFVPIAYWMIRFRGTAAAFFFFYLVFFMCADSACPGNCLDHITHILSTTLRLTPKRIAALCMLVCTRHACPISCDMLRRLPCAGRVLTLFTFFGQFLVYVSPSIQMAQIMASGGPLL